jgi:hypothetical protein
MNTKEVGTDTYDGSCKSASEGEHSGECHLKLEHVEHVEFHPDHCSLIEGTVADVHKVFDLWRVDLLELGGNEETGSSEQLGKRGRGEWGGSSGEGAGNLELVLLDLLDGQVPVDDVHRKRQDRLHQLELPGNRVRIPIHGGIRW